MYATYSSLIKTHHAINFYILIEIFDQNLDCNTFYQNWDLVSLMWRDGFLRNFTVALDWLSKVGLG